MAAIVKKSISIRDELDESLRKLWSQLILKGYHVRYSDVANLLFFAGLISPLFVSSLDEFFETIAEYLQKRGNVEKDFEKALEIYNSRIKPYRREKK